MTILNQTLNPISAEERVKINQNWDRIMQRFSSLQSQINILSGETTVEEILNALNDAINNANSTVQGLVDTSNQSIANVNQKITEVDGKLVELQTAIDNANLATNATNSAISDARQAISDINDYFENFRFVGEYNATTTYRNFNFVRYQKSTFVSLKENLGITPNDDGINWRLVAAGGIDGMGSVVSVNGKNPDSNGEVTLIPTDIGAASSNQINETNNNLSTLQQQVTTHLADIEQRAINVKFPPPPLMPAVGDSATDDAPKIQAIIEYAHVNKFDIYIPNSIYRVDSPIKRKGNVSIYGQNMINTVLKSYNTLGGAIIDTVNESLHGVIISNLKFEKDTSVIGNVIGILGGSTLEKYNSAVGTFERLYFNNIYAGIIGNGEPTGVGIFDSLFNDIFASTCEIGIQFDGSGNTVNHPRIVLCSNGFVYKHLNSESFAGVNVNGGIFIQNTFDIGIPDAEGLRPCSFNGTWFEQSTYGLVNIPNANTKLMSFSFRDCMLSTNAENFDLLNFYNALGSITLDTCTIAQVNNSSVFVRNPLEDGGYLNIKNCLKIMNDGTRNIYNYNKMSDWKNVTLQNDWVNVGETTVTKYCKTEGNVVHLQIGMKDGSPNNSTIIGELPIGHRPSQSVRFFVYDITNSKIVNMYVGTNGSIVITGDGNMTGIWAGYISFKVES